MPAGTIGSEGRRPYGTNEMVQLRFESNCAPHSHRKTEYAARQHILAAPSTTQIYLNYSVAP